MSHFFCQLKFLLPQVFAGECTHQKIPKIEGWYYHFQAVVILKHFSIGTEAEKQDEEDEEPKPGFSFSKSAIADLPSTAVQSIHIENEGPVEVDDDVFVWHDTKSGTKLKVKIKKKTKLRTAKHQPRSPIKIAMPPAKQKKKKTAKYSGSKMCKNNQQQESPFGGANDFDE